MKCLPKDVDKDNVAEWEVILSTVTHNTQANEDPLEDNRKLLTNISQERYVCSKVFPDRHEEAIKY